MLYEFCEAHGVPHRRCGKLIVAQDDDEIEALETLRRAARPMASRGCAWSTTRSSAPASRTCAPGRRSSRRTRGILEAEGAGANAGTALRGARRVRAAGITARRRATPGSDGIELRTPAETIVARTVVNAAGLFADEVSAALGGEPFRIYPCRGEYAELVPSKRSLVNALVYPLPHTPRARRPPVEDHPRQRHARPDRRLPGPEGRLRGRSHSGRRLPRARARAAPGADARGPAPRRQRHPAEAPPSRASFADFLIARDGQIPRLVQAAGHRIAGADGVPGHRRARGGPGGGDSLVGSWQSAVGEWAVQPAVVASGFSRKACALPTAYCLLR